MPLLSTASQPQYHQHQQSQPSTSASAATASLISFSNTTHASNEPAKTDSSTPSSYCNQMEQQQPTAEGENDSTAAAHAPGKSLIGCNGIKSNLNSSLNLIQFGDNASNNTTTATTTINTGDNSNNDYCNTSNSGTGEAKAYKLLNSLS